MSTLIIKEEADLNSLPAIRPDGKDLSLHTVTIGDVHGNALKLLYFLVREGVLTLKDNPKETYAEFVRIYMASKELTPSDFTKANNLITNCFSLNKVKLVRLIGDEMFDRGNNDILTLLLLKKLNDSNTPFEILLSNHSIEFFMHLENHPEKYSTTDSCKISGKSMISFIKKMSPNSPERALINKIITKAYKPAIKLISYTLHSTNKKTINIFTHAPVGLKTIKALAELFNVKFCDQSLLMLCNTIDQINLNTKKVIAEGGLHNIYNPHYTESQYIPPRHPLYAILWNREISTNDDDYKSRHPDDYTITWIHGHTGKKRKIREHTPDNAEIINLDHTNLGKTYGCFHRTSKRTGYYLALKEKNDFNFQPDFISEKNKLQQFLVEQHDEARELALAISQYWHKAVSDDIKIQCLFMLRRIIPYLMEAASEKRKQIDMEVSATNNETLNLMWVTHVKPIIQTLNIKLNTLSTEIEALHNDSQTPLSMAAMAACASAKEASTTSNYTEHRALVTAIRSTKVIISTTYSSQPDYHLVLNEMKNIHESAGFFSTNNNKKWKRFSARLGIFTGITLFTLGIITTSTGLGALVGTPLATAGITLCLYSKHKLSKYKIAKKTVAQSSLSLSLFKLHQESTKVAHPLTSKDSIAMLEADLCGDIVLSPYN